MGDGRKPSLVKCGEFMYIKCLVQRMNQGMSAVLIRARARAFPSSPAWDPAQSGSPATSGLGSIKRPPSGPQAVLPALHFMGETRGETGKAWGQAAEGGGTQQELGGDRGRGQSPCCSHSLMCACMPSWAAGGLAPSAPM